jgi:alpha-glucosidase (family GH31 glycosyl hydrolase)
MKKILTLLLLSTAALLSAQTPFNFDLKLHGHLRIDFCTDNLFRVRYSATGGFVPDENWMVRRYAFPPVQVTRTEARDETTLATATLRLRISPDALIVERAGEPAAAVWTALHPNLEGDTLQLCMLKQSDEHFFGLGERMDFLDQTGKRVRLNVELGGGRKPAVGGKDVLRANYCPVPFMMSTGAQGLPYGLFVHTAYPTLWDLGWTDGKQYTVDLMGASQVDYYFVGGTNFYELLDGYTDLTGKSPMLPRYAMGLHLGSYSGGTWKYETATSDRYPVELAARMRAEGIPFDLLWLDSTWRTFTNFGNGGCAFEWRNTFKNPEQMFKDVYALNVKAFGLHIRSILADGPQYNLLTAARKQGNILVPNASAEGLVNFFDAKAVDWWWDNAARKVVDQGAMFFKTDVGSAYRLNPQTATPQQLKEAPALHNLFPLAYGEAPYRKFMEMKPNTRGLTHTREGYAGIQRYPYIWAGDWGSEWQWFEPVISSGLSIGMSGVGWWTHCMGGFEQYSPYDTELYIRWCQFGLFSPIAMLFGMDHPRYHEPWTYGKEAMDIFRKYDRLRYRLIPYIYTYGRKLYDTARPLMTPLVMDYPQDVNTYQLARQYMFGEWMMVCPVTTKGALSQAVYFPGGDWFDYDSGERISGRQYKSFLTPIEQLPIYIKAGAILPMQPLMEWEGERPFDVLTLDIYPHGTSFFDLYEDDGTTLDYQRGLFSTTRFESKLEGDTWHFIARKPQGRFRPEAHRYELRVLLDKAPSAVSENGTPLKRLASADEVHTTVGWYYEEAAKRLLIKTQGDNSGEVMLTTKQ